MEISGFSEQPMNVRGKDAVRVRVGWRLAIGCGQTGRKQWRRWSYASVGPKK